MRDRLSIGEFAKLTGLTPRALRFYDEAGLLRPDETDPDTGYRYYRHEQAEEAERVRLLRSLDVPVEEVRRVLNLDPETSKAIVANHKLRIEDRIVRYQQALHALERLEQGAPPYGLAVKRVPSQPILYSRHLTSLSRLEPTRTTAFGALHHFLIGRGLNPSGPGFVALVGTDYETPYLEGEETFDTDTWGFEIDVCLPLAHPVEEESSFCQRVWPAGEVVYGVHVGPYEPLHLLAKAMRTWARDRNYELVAKREIYLVGPWDTQDRSRFRTEVQYTLR